ncbi:acetyl-CoA acetyltransferase [Bordetella trematum]|uniref:acetyl-CoA C-acetyltransferase n=1 Tax=Bordetella trematum TaxID=123899 RepID=UPI0007B559E3|nr:acetyl-CoA C-acetyltransferase [Bordetella trematum]AZR96078.1 acetyl-CoA acetyltransferase [Bordetella trematum]NNH17424.1 acetyl-CoA C-acetyltransferase [Bordetella trematum]
MRRAAVVAPVRTAVGAFGGALRAMPVEDLAASVVREVVARSGIDPARIDDAVFAQSYANSEVPCVGRWAALHAGLPVEVPGMQLDRRCGGGLQAVASAAMMVQTGAADVVLCGGVESMSNIEYYSMDMRWGKRAGSGSFYDRLERGRERSQPVERFGVISGMIETAENVAQAFSITREQSDAYALESHRRASAAHAQGLFRDEIVALDVPQRKGPALRFEKDEGVRAEASLSALARLRPLLDGGVVTAGNASQQSDAAAACLVVAEDQLERLGLEPMGYLVGWAAAGCEPATMGMGPVPATAKLMARLGLSLADMDLIEVNEAFACQVLAVLRQWGLHDHARVNVNGSGISLGHPIGATGVRIMASLLHEMKRRGARYALETMCVGGGQGVAAVFERA